MICSGGVQVKGRYSVSMVLTNYIHMYWNCDRKRGWGGLSSLLKAWGSGYDKTTPGQNFIGFKPEAEIQL